MKLRFNTTLFAGTEDRTFWSSKPNPNKCCFEPTATLHRHKKAVVPFIVGARRFYYGSMNCTLREHFRKTCSETLKKTMVSGVITKEETFSVDIKNLWKVGAAEDHIYLPKFAPAHIAGVDIEGSDGVGIVKKINFTPGGIWKT